MDVLFGLIFDLLPKDFILDFGVYIKVCGLLVPFKQKKFNLDLYEKLSDCVTDEKVCSSHPTKCRAVGPVTRDNVKL